jgi:hypothetical protein
MCGRQSRTGIGLPLGAFIFALLTIILPILYIHYNVIASCEDGDPRSSVLIPLLDLRRHGVTSQKTPFFRDKNCLFFP